MKWQRELCESLGLKGRIILAQEGINGTIGGSAESLEAYKEAMNAHEYFGDIDWKESEGSSEDFPRMRIVIKDEICHLGLDTKKFKAQNGGKHLTPAEVNELIENNKDLVIIDCRNDYEVAIGTFKNAINPKTEYFREFPEYVDNNTDLLKDKEVLMFCTGGIRCERASSYVKSKDAAKEVYQIKGGIHRYIEQFPDGHFRGKNYVFDGRIAVQANEDILGSCYICQEPNDDYTNCLNAECNLQYLGCPACLATLANCCSERCLKLVQEKKVVIRTIPTKTEQLKKDEATQ
jgi:predicted sulfurtransferase